MTGHAQRRAVIVLAALERLAEGEARICWTTVTRLAKRTGLERRAIQRALRDLEAWGRIVPTDNGRDYGSAYRVLRVTGTPFLAAAAGTLPSRAETRQEVAG